MILKKRERTSLGAILRQVCYFLCCFGPVGVSFLCFVGGVDVGGGSVGVGDGDVDTGCCGAAGRGVVNVGDGGVDGMILAAFLSVMMASMLVVLMLAFMLVFVLVVFMLATVVLGCWCRWC